MLKILICQMCIVLFAINSTQAQQLIIELAPPNPASPYYSLKPTTSGSYTFKVKFYNYDIYDYSVTNFKLQNLSGLNAGSTISLVGNPTKTIRSSSSEEVTFKVNITGNSCAQHLFQMRFQTVRVNSNINVTYNAIFPYSHGFDAEIVYIPNGDKKGDAILEYELKLNGNQQVLEVKTLEYTTGINCLLPRYYFQGTNGINNGRIEDVITDIKIEVLKNCNQVVSSKTYSALDIAPNDVYNINFSTVLDECTNYCLKYTAKNAVGKHLASYTINGTSFSSPIPSSISSFGNDVQVSFTTTKIPVLTFASPLNPANTYNHVAGECLNYLPGVEYKPNTGKFLLATINNSCPMLKLKRSYGAAESEKIKTEDNPTTDYSDNQNFVIYPNPTQNTVNINFGSKLDKVEVLSLAGKLVLVKQQIDDGEKLDLTALKNGVYFINIHSNGQVFRKKVIKQ